MRCRAKHIATLGFLRLERMIAARSATALLNMRRAQGHIESIVGANKVEVGQVSQMRDAARDHCLEYGLHPGGDPTARRHQRSQHLESGNVLHGSIPRHGTTTRRIKT